VFKCLRVTTYLDTSLMLLNNDLIDMMYQDMMATSQSMED